MKTQKESKTREHTPTPWINKFTFVTDDNGDLVANCRTMFDKPTDDANAAFIVRAVNSHGKLIKALLEIRDRLTMAQDASGNTEINRDEIKIINEAIRQAEGE